MESHLQDFNRTDSTEAEQRLRRAAQAERESRCELLADLAEIEVRRLYLSEGFPSMHAYCIEGMQMDEDEIDELIHAARAARQFPILFDAMADGRLHTAAVCLLASYLTTENVDELVAATTHKPESEIKRYLEERFPRTGKL